MEAIKYRTLTDAKDIDNYLAHFEGHVKVKLPYDYAHRARIVGAFMGDNLVGGYMLVTRPDFRSLMFVPDQMREEHAFFANDQYEMMEVNGLWIGKQVKSAKQQFGIWLHMLRDVFLCRKKYVLLMADQRNVNILKIHELMGSQVIYQGPPMLRAGATTHSSIRVGYATRWSLVRNLPAYLLEYRQRQRKSSRRRLSGNAVYGNRPARIS